MPQDRGNYQILYANKLKREALLHYALDGKPSCSCCACPLEEFLELDHIHGGGSALRATHHSRLSWWLKKNNYPDGFQILCSLCNRSKNGSGECRYHKSFPKRIWPENIEYLV